MLTKPWLSYLIFSRSSMYVFNSLLMSAMKFLSSSVKFMAGTVPPKLLCTNINALKNSEFNGQKNTENKLRKRSLVVLAYSVNHAIFKLSFAFVSKYTLMPTSRNEYYSDEPVHHHTNIHFHKKAFAPAAPASC